MKKLTSVVASLAASAPDATIHTYKCDVSDRASVTNVIETAALDLGGLDIVVANAGIADHIPAIDYPEDAFPAHAGCEFPRRLLDRTGGGARHAPAEI